MQFVKDSWWRRHFSSPTRVIVFSFLAVIIVGSILLSTPLCSKNGAFTSPVDAIFTATSATCVTGLIVVDTYSHWNLFGQIIILAMIQIGGIGLVTLTAFFNRAIGRKMGVRNLVVAKESMIAEDLFETSQLMQMIVRFTFGCEAVGAALLCIAFIPRLGFAQGLWTSVFLAVSSFCNAGFDILGFNGEFSSLTAYSGDPLVLITIMALIVFGGMGFIVWFNLYSFRKKKKLMLHTKLVLIMTAIMLVIGFAAFAAIEWNNPQTLGRFNTGDKLLNAMFQSVSLRTAGFNTINFHGANDVTKLISMFLMFVGAAPGSTAGGLKITTFAVLVMTVICVIRGDDDTYIAGRRVAKTTVYKALAVLSTMLLLVIVATGVIYYTSKFHDLKLIDSAFEAVSAIGTVGVSSGATAVGNFYSRTALILMMFVGRVGPVSLALSLAMRQEKKRKNQVVPEAKIVIG